MFKKRLLVLLIMMTGSFAQNNITGKVINMENNIPIVAVNISIMGTEIGKESDKEGQFNFSNLESGSLTLIFSHIGYKTKKMQLTLPYNEPLIIMLEESFFKMDAVVVTSTRTKKIHRNVPIATEVINEKDIQMSGALNISDLLTQRSGVNISTSVEGASTLNLMGMDSRYILILIDGQPITGKFNSRVSLDQIPTSIIQHIEIIKGPNSALYGSEAMGGVINIITDNPTNNGLITKFQYRSSGSKNNFHVFDPQLGSKNFQSLIHFPFKNIKVKFDVDINLLNTEKNVQSIDIDNINKGTFRCLLNWKNMLDISFQSYQHNENGNSELMNTDTKIWRNNWKIHNQLKLGKLMELNQNLWITDYNRTYEQALHSGPIVKINNTKENTLEYELNFLKHINNNILNIGTELSHSKYISDRILGDKQIINTGSVFSQYEIKSLFGFHTIAGIRMDNYSENDLVLSPRIGFMYDIDSRWKFRSTWGNGFRAPTFMEKFIDWNHVQFGYQVIGNPKLNPERSTGFTVGVEYYHPVVYQVSLMLYHTKFKDMIHDYTIEPGVLSYKNIDNAIYNGLEIQGKWKISNQMNSTWNINYVDNQDNDGNTISNTQPLSANIGYNFQSHDGRWSTYLQCKWTGSYTPQIYNTTTGDFNSSEITREDYYIIDINTQYNFYGSMIIGIGSKNIGNYTDEEYGPFIGRTNYIEIKIKNERK